MLLAGEARSGQTLRIDRDKSGELVLISAGDRAVDT